MKRTDTRKAKDARLDHFFAKRSTSKMRKEIERLEDGRGRRKTEEELADERREK